LNAKYIVSDTKLEASNMTLVKKFSECKECAVGNAFGPYLYKNDLFLPRYYMVQKGILVVGDASLVKEVVYSIMLQDWDPKSAVLIEGTKINDYDLDFLKEFSVILLVKDSVDQNSIEKLRGFSSQGGVIVPDILNGQNSVSNEDISLILKKTTTGYKEINIDEYSNNKVVLDLNEERGWLVASERFAHFPGWAASINGKDIKMLKADNAISALHLNGEKGKLVFDYKPNSYRKGRLISLLAFTIIIIYFSYFVYKKMHKSGDKNKN